MTNDETHAIHLIMRQVMDHNKDEFAALVGEITGTCLGISVAGGIFALPSGGTSLIVSAVALAGAAIASGVTLGYAYVMHASAIDSIKACIDIYHDFLE